MSSMRYIYDLYQISGEKKWRVATSTSLDELLEERRPYTKSEVLVTDTLNHTFCILETTDDFEGWATARERDIWKPFDEKETGIHVKQTALADTNVKTAAAAGKPKTSGVPPEAIRQLAAAMQNGVDKYGRYNWRGTAVTATVFYDAMVRHLLAWFEGENVADDSKVHHLAHLMACCAIIIDAEKHGVFKDDRTPK